MNTKLIKGRYQRKRSTPFVCHYVPFICIKSSIRRPFVCDYMPFVGSSGKTNGFTLIELMITLVIAAVLMTIAAPAFTTFIANQRISTQANDLLTDLSFARSEAVKRGAAVTVCKTANPDAAAPVCNATDADRWTAGRIVFIDPANPGVVDAGEQILKIRQALDGTQTTGNLILGFGDISGTANRITFAANGASHLAAEGELLVCDNRGDAQGFAVAISATGRARVTARGKDKAGAVITACP